MSFELSISGGRTISTAAWLSRAKRLGVVIEPHPQFVFDTHSEYLPVKVTVTKPTLFAGADRWVAAGPLAAGMVFEVDRFGPDATGVDAAARIPHFDRRLAQLVELAAPEVLVDLFREKRVSFEQSYGDTSDDQLVWFGATPRTPAHSLAFIVSVAAYALAAGGTIGDANYPAIFPNGPGGDDILSALADVLASWFSNVEDPGEVGEPFRDWNG